MVFPVNSFYSVRATALLFCRMFIHKMEVCMFTGFLFPSNILKMTDSWTFSFCSSVRIWIHDLFDYHLLQFWSYSFNICMMLIHIMEVDLFIVYYGQAGASFVPYRQTSFKKSHR